MGYFLGNVGNYDNENHCSVAQEGKESFPKY